MSRSLIAVLVVAGLVVGAFLLISLPRAIRYLLGNNLDLIVAEAEGIDGVVVLDAGGNQDIMLEDIWLELEIDGVPVSFSQVTWNSFHQTDHLAVYRIGEWGFKLRGYRAPNLGPGKPARDASMWGTRLSLGRDGDWCPPTGGPVGNIPEFVRRLPELIKDIAAIPEGPPGVYLGRGPGTNALYHLWVYRVRRE